MSSTIIRPLPNVSWSGSPIRAGAAPSSASWWPGQPCVSRKTNCAISAGTQLAGFKCPKRFVVVDALPRNSMGKVEKFRVRAEIGAGAAEFARGFCRAGLIPQLLDHVIRREQDVRGNFQPELLCRLEIDREFKGTLGTARPRARQKREGGLLELWPHCRQRYVWLIGWAALWVRNRTLKQCAPPGFIPEHGERECPRKTREVELEMKIMKARQLARQADDTTRERLEALAAIGAQAQRVRRINPSVFAAKRIFEDKLKAANRAESNRRGDAAKWADRPRP